jgi:hypothetical protein
MIISPAIPARLTIFLPVPEDIMPPRFWVGPIKSCVRFQVWFEQVWVERKHPDRPRRLAGCFDIFVAASLPDLPGRAV